MFAKRFDLFGLEACRAVHIQRPAGKHLRRVVALADFHHLAHVRPVADAVGYDRI